MVIRREVAGRVSRFRNCQIAADRRSLVRWPRIRSASPSEEQSPGRPMHIRIRVMCFQSCLSRESPTAPRTNQPGSGWRATNASDQLQAIIPSMLRTRQIHTHLRSEGAWASEGGQGADGAWSAWAAAHGLGGKDCAGELQIQPQTGWRCD